MSEEPEQTQHENKLANFKLDQEHAKRAHDLNRQSAFEFQKAAVDSANLAMRSLILVNGGAVIALLAFIGGIESGDNSHAVTSAALVSPILSFAIGVGLATLTAALAYIVNMLDADMTNAVTLTWQHPYVSDKPLVAKLRRLRVTIHIFAICMALAALVAFFFGIFGIAEAVEALNL